MSQKYCSDTKHPRHPKPIRFVSFHQTSWVSGVGYGIAIAYSADLSVRETKPMTSAVVKVNFEFGS
jgi:hypothetical protein